MPPPGMAGAPFSSGLSAMTASVVRNRAAMEAAFWRADRVTLAASMTPGLNRSSYSPVAAAVPQPTRPAVVLHLAGGHHGRWPWIGLALLLLPAWALGASRFAPNLLRLDSNT